MSCCGKSGKNRCVCDKVREIARVQDAVDNNCCESGSCHRAIEDLVSPTGGDGRDTIPFVLLCGCENTFAGLLPYFAWGVKKFNGCSALYPSPFFRVKRFVEGKRCCAILELLYPERCDGHLFKYSNFYRTGICVEVDLSKFTGITCFHPVAALNASEADMDAGAELVQQLKADPSMMGSLSSEY